MACSKPIRHFGTDGFTLLEVLAALTLTVVLVFVISASLTTVIRGEETAEWLRQGVLLVRTIPSQVYLNSGANAAEGKAFDQWSVSTEDVRFERDEEEERWRVWELTPKSRSGLLIPLALRRHAP